MANSSKANDIEPSAESHLDGYDSMMLRSYIEILAGLDQELQILDLGPVCEENILYFSQRVKKFYVCDMFIRMDRNRRKPTIVDSSLLVLHTPLGRRK